MINVQRKTLGNWQLKIQYWILNVPKGPLFQSTVANNAQ
jgi:hypothetical protein